MKAKILALGLASTATLLAPISASALAAGRAIAPVEEGSDLASGSSVLLGIFAAAAIIVGIAAAASDDENSPPISG